MGRVTVLLACAFLWLLSAPARADEGEPVSEEAPDAVTQARAAFVEGAALAGKMRWGEALDRFESSASMNPHAGTSYNLGICHRALGHYTRAQVALRRALRQNEAAHGAELAEDTLENIAAFLAEIERVLATVEVTLDPPGAAITVDGRPLQVREHEPKGKTVLVGGTLPAAPGKAPPRAKFTMIVDPGAHVLVISRAGFDDAVVRHQVLPGSKTSLVLKLERLPATLHVGASETEAAVSVDGVDVGVAPVTLLRPAGDYEVWVQKRGFDAYQADVKLRAAQRVDLMARLQPTEIGLHERWWFWAALGTAVASTVVVTYFVTRPEPERPPLDGGGLGWTIRVP